MIELNFANMTKEMIGASGIDEAEISALSEKARQVHAQIAGRGRPEMEWLDLPSADFPEVRAYAKEVKEGSDTFLVLGIGGSALGPRAVLEALSPFHNIKKSPRVFIYDNVDPRTLEGILSIVDLRRTTVNVISKSGSTAETAASFMILWDAMKKAVGGDAARRFIATTDPVSGSLRKLAAEEKMRTLPIGRGVGGRFSVLSPVGLLLAEVIGADSKELLRGAADMNARCGTDDIMRNPAYLFGTLLHIMRTERHRSINVLLPYADSLKYLSEWFCQLWAESLGKEGTGMTPYPSVGTTDQHSQLQLWMEGPQDKTVVFIRPGDYGADFVMPDVFMDIESTSYLAGQRLSELIKAEEESTELALTVRGRPNMTINLPKIDAYHMGQMFQFFAIATAFTGLMMEIDPFNQPGVEEGKQFTYGMMGRKGFEAKRAEVEKARGAKTRWTV